MSGEEQVEEVVPVAEISLPFSVNLVCFREINLEFPVGIGDRVVFVRSLEDLYQAA